MFLTSQIHCESNLQSESKEKVELSTDNIMQTSDISGLTDMARKMLEEDPEVRRCFLLSHVPYRKLHVHGVSWWGAYCHPGYAQPLNPPTLPLHFSPI